MSSKQVTTRPRGLNNADVVKSIKAIIPTYKCDYICWKYAPFCVSYDLQEGSFQELQSKSYQFPPSTTEQACNQWLLDDDMQTALRLLLERTNTLALFELQQNYTERAKDDTNALKGLLELNKVLFTKNGDSKLFQLLEGISDDDMGGD